MADKKISQLTALSAANVASATDVLAIVDTSATETKKITAKDLIDGALNGGTANGVLYLNGSKVATSGSALTFDGTNLGIGTTSPAAKLHVSNGSNSDSGDFTAFVFGGTDATNSRTGSIIKGTSTPYNTIFRYQNNTGTTTGSLIFQNGSTPQATLDSSGNLGLGVTPSAWGSGFKAIQISTGGGWMADGANSYFSANSYWNGTNWIRNLGNAAARYQMESGIHSWYNAASGTAGNTISFTQAMTLDASGNLAVGTTTVDERLRLNGDSNATSRIRLQNQGTTLGWFGSYLGITALGNGNDLFVANATANALIFGTNGTERGRFTAGGYFKASNTGTYDNATTSNHELNQSAAGINVLITNTNASETAAGVVFIQANRNTTNGTFYALSYYNIAAAAYKFRVADSGDVTNTNGTYGTISDAKMKTDIVDAGSQWADLKAVRFRKFKMKDDPSGITQLGVVAQELEQTSPGLVAEHANRDAEGNDLGTTTKSVKTSILLMKAAVALQEAMARIEQLEADMAALKASA